METAEKENPNKSFIGKLSKIFSIHRKALSDLEDGINSHLITSVYKIENRDFQEFLFSVPTKKSHSYIQINSRELFDHPEGLMALMAQIDTISRQLDLHLDEFRKILLQNKPKSRQAVKWNIQSIQKEMKKMGFLNGSPIS